MVGVDKSGCSRAPALKLDEKRKLAKLVQTYPEVWELTHVNYKNRDARESAWKKIASKMEMTAERCKKGWSSLQDSLRYQKNGKKKGKSGKGNDEDPDDTEFSHDDVELLESWNMWEAMKFYVLSKPTRTTISNLPRGETEVDESQGDMDGSENNDDSVIQIDDGDGSQIPEVSAHSTPVTPVYSHVNMKRKHTDNLDNTTTALVNSVNSLVELKKSRSENGVRGQDLKHYSMFLNLDRMLQKLPETVVEDLNMMFMTAIHDELKKQQQT